ncbi:MAG: endonuclease III, partial [Deltaproteobacteria bacterium]|nr:endonuclease III [Deltaproteobacteria bacterium]
MTEAERLAKIIELLERAEPAPKPALRYRDAWELLVATVLSAQTTDARVNQTTPALFARYPTPEALAAADPREVEELIRSIGLFRTKSRNLVALAGRIAGEHGGRVPDERDALERLPGVGRKTASVVLAQGFEVPAFAVDTHVGRVVMRLGFSPTKEPRRAEEAVTALLEPRLWGKAHLLLIRHGRTLCTSQRPRCPICPVREL